MVTSSTDAAIANNSTCDVRVTGISARTENGWTLVPFEYNMAAAKVDSKLIGFAIGGAQSVDNGDSETLALTGDWSIDAGAVLRWTTTPTSPRPPLASTSRCSRSYLSWRKWP